MTFLSRLRLHPRDLLVIRDLGDPRELHRTVMRAFPEHAGSPPRAHFGVLFRAEVPQDRSGATLLVQSTVAADWAALPEGYVLGSETKEISAIVSGFAERQEYVFRLVANPSFKSSRETDGAKPKNSRRYGLVDPAARLDWLARKAEQFGFVLVDGTVDVSDEAAIGRPTPRERAPRVQVRAARFDGRLVVVDPVLFRQAVLEGVGPAKAYGCGLLSLATVR